METRELTDGSLLVSHDSTAWTRWLVSAGVVCAAAAAYEAVVRSTREERFLGLLGGAATLVLIGLAFAESGQFTIDPTRRVIEWRRRWAWWRRSGTIAFDQVKDVTIECPIGDEGVPSRRICLRLADGSLLPLRAAYVPDAGDATLKLAERIRRMVGVVQRSVESAKAAPAGAAADRAAVADAAEAEVRALLERGRVIEAIKLLRVTRKLSLLEAKREVDEMRAGVR